jgi:hypothetical protein
MKRVVFLIIVVLLCQADSVGQNESSLEYDVKAAFLHNFANFVAWPRQAFPTPTAPFRICILGRDPFQGALGRIAQGEAVDGHPRLVERFDDVGELKACHIVFVPASEQSNVNAVLNVVGALPVLTVGESPRFLEGGGIVNFAIERNRVRFDINVNRAEQNGLKISSKLLRLARTTRVNQARN